MELTDKQKRPYQNALMAQGACNLGALVLTLVDDLGTIRTEPAFNGSDYLAQHPVVRLYLEQLAHLSGITIDDERNPYSKAYDICQERAAATKTAAYDPAGDDAPVDPSQTLSCFV